MTADAPLPADAGPGATGPPDPQALRQGALQVARTLREAGHEVYFAGGSVRDRLLDRPAKDIDIATSASPEQVQRLFPRTIPVGAQFGVVLVVQAGQPFEVATFRTDGIYLDGRRPESVAYGDAIGDARRRDFTINGLFEDPETGEIHDHIGGRADLAARVLRAIGDPTARFRDDRLRMLRAIRFAAELSFTIEPETLEAIRQHHLAIADVSAERILQELTRTIVAPGRVEALRLLQETGLLAVLLPEVEALRGVEQPPQFHPEGDCWAHQLLVMSHLPKNPAPALAWGALLHDIGKPPTFRVADRIRFDRHAEVGADMARRVLRRLRSSRELRELTFELVRDHLWFMNMPHMREATIKRFLRRPTAPLHLALHRADCLGCHGKLDSYEACIAMLERCQQEGREAALRPPPLVTGRDLIALGYEPGPLFGEILRAVETAQLEGDLKTADEAIVFVHTRFPR